MIAARIQYVATMLTTSNPMVAGQYTRAAVRKLWQELTFSFRLRTPHFGRGMPIIVISRCSGFVILHIGTGAPFRHFIEKGAVRLASDRLRRCTDGGEACGGDELMPH